MMIVTSDGDKKSLRYNEGKPDYTYVEKSTMDAIARVCEFGAQKYDRDNWKSSAGTNDHTSFQRGCLSSMLRHLWAALSGEKIDPESGLPHMAHVATNVMFWLYYEDQGNEVR